MINDFIISDPEIMGGTPCIKGTRITVYAIAARLVAESVNDLLADYPYLTGEAISAAAEWAGGRA